VAGPGPPARTRPRRRNPSRISRMLVCPAPLGPSSAKISPYSTVRLTPSTAATAPYRLTSLSTTTALTVDTLPVRTLPAHRRGGGRAPLPRGIGRGEGTRKVGRVEQRILGRTGRSGSVVGLGPWQLGADWGDVDEATALAVLDAAAESGITLFDSADVYGDGRSEQLIGQWRLANAGHSLTVATKVGRRVAQLPENY